jgi:hypothetical protein
MFQVLKRGKSAPTVAYASSRGSLRIVTRPASHLFLPIGIGFIAAVALVCGATMVRLLLGPVSLGPLTPVVESALNRGLIEHRVAIGDTVLRWSRSEGRVDLRFVDVTLKNREGALLAEVPEMRLGFSAKALLNGVIAPAEVAIFRPAATVVRREDGRVQLGFSRDNEDGVVQGSDRFFSMLLAVLREAPNRETHTGYLKRFVIRDATLTFYDAITHSLWRAPDAVLSFARGAKGLDAHLDAAMVSGKKRFLVTARGTLERATDLFHVTANLEGFVPSTIAEKSVAFAPLKGVAVPLKGMVTATFTGKGAVQEGRFELKMGRGRVLMPGLSALALDVTSAEAVGHYDPKSDSIVLERLAYDAGPNKAFASGTLGMIHGEGGAIDGLNFKLGARDVSINLPKLFSAPGHIESVALGGHLDFAARTLTLDQAVLANGATSLNLKGVIVDAEAAPAVTLTGSIERLPFGDLAKLWPIGPALGARDWIVANVARGVLTNGNLSVNAPAGALARERLADDVVKLAFDFDGLELNYIRGLSPITEGHGHAVLSGNRFDLWLDQGRVGELRLSEGTFVVPDLSTPGGAGDISAHLTGRTESLLSVLDMQPLGYATKFGVDPQTVAGNVDARLAVHVPLLKDITWDQIGFKTQASLTDFALPALYRDFAVQKGALDVAVNESGLKAKGDVLIGGYPATLEWNENFNAGQNLPTTVSVRTTLDAQGRTRASVPLDRYATGPTPLDVVLKGHGTKLKEIDLNADLTQAAVNLPELDYRKDKGTKGALAFRLDLENAGALGFKDIALTASGLDIRGSVDLGVDGHLVAANLNPLHAGPNNQATLHVVRGDADALSLTIKGRSLDLSQAIDELSDEWRASESENKPPLALSVKLDSLELAHSVVMKDVDLRYAQARDRLTELSLRGVANSKAKVNAALTPDLAGRRHLKVDTDDAGALLAGLALTGNVVGGTLDLDITLPEKPSAAAEMPGSGTLRMDNFRVVKAPALAKLFAVGSLGAMGDLLNGDGIAFEKLEAPFTLVDGSIELGRSQAYGPAVGLTLQGEIPRAKGDMDLTGTLVPAYTLNTLLGYVPIFGTLLTSRTGEGVFGFTYAVSGDPSDPRVFVNPLSAFTPGVLRRIFQLDEGVEAKRRAEPEEKPIVPQ